MINIVINDKFDKVYAKTSSNLVKYIIKEIKKNDDLCGNENIDKLQSLLVNNFKDFKQYAFKYASNRIKRNKIKNCNFDLKLEWMAIGLQPSFNQNVI